MMSASLSEFMATVLPSARKMEGTREYIRRAWRRSALTSSTSRTRYFFVLYMAQKVQALWGHPKATWIISEPASQGGRNRGSSYSGNITCSLTYSMKNRSKFILAQASAPTQEEAAEPERRESM